VTGFDFLKYMRKPKMSDTKGVLSQPQITINAARIIILNFFHVNRQKSFYNYLYRLNTINYLFTTNHTKNQYLIKAKAVPFFN
jgi:hypothetical protein